MHTESTPQDQGFGLSEDELAYWNENGYLVRLDVFTPEENDAFRQVAEDIVDGKRPFPPEHIDPERTRQRWKGGAARHLCDAQNPFSELLRSRISRPCA